MTRSLPPLALAFLVGAVVVGPAHAAQEPRAGRFDARVRTVPYNPMNPVRLVGSTFTSTQIIFAVGETVTHVAIGDSDGHVGLGVKCAKEVATAIRGAIILAKLSVVPIRRGYWGTNLGEPHSLPTKESGKCGSVTVRLIPAPRGTGLVASPAVKRLLQLAGVADIYTASSGSTKTLENTLKATFVAVAHTYGFLTPNLWAEKKLTPSPLEEYSDILREGKRY